MAFRLSQEEANYVRMSLLLTGISSRAVRVLFDREFAPACLDSSLKKEYNKLRDLQKQRIINQEQWKLLFPRFPGKYECEVAIRHNAHSQTGNRTTIKQNEICTHKQNNYFASGKN